MTKKNFEEYENGAIYADSDGCLLSCFVHPAADEPYFLAFGRNSPIKLSNLTGPDEPVTLVFDNNGDTHIFKLNYKNGTNVYE